jgi:cytochrome oxidase Cu insertion factor (SCO1/SenC/PrrC family)
MRYLLIPVLFVTACVRPEPLPFFGSVPDFKLTTQFNTILQRKDLEGKVWVADFIYTTCTGPCPLMTRKMRQVQSAEPKVLLISFSVDPEYDTPEVLAAYSRSVHALPRWFFLTGDRAALQMLSREAFKLADLGLTHSTRLVLVDDKSRIRGYYTEVPELLAGLRRLGCCRP